MRANKLVDAEFLTEALAHDGIQTLSHSSTPLAGEPSPPASETLLGLGFLVTSWPLSPACFAASASPLRPFLVETSRILVHCTSFALPILTELPHLHGFNSDLSSRRAPPCASLSVISLSGFHLISPTASWALLIDHPGTVHGRSVRWGNEGSSLKPITEAFKGILGFCGLRCSFKRGLWGQMISN